jgi:hypothetical protein
MSYYGCHNGLDAFIVSSKSGESYFCDLQHCQVPTPYSQIHYKSQMTYNTLIAHEWKALTRCQVNELTKTMYLAKAPNMSGNITKTVFIVSIACLISNIKNLF